MDGQRKSLGRRALLGAIGGVLLVFGVGRKNAAQAAGANAKPSPREVCVECLTKRAAQRTAFINKWI